MGFKKFIKPTRGKIILFIVIAVLALLSSLGLRIRCVGTCEISTLDKIINYVPKITSPGINALLSDNGFFINYKPSGNFGAVVEGIFHWGLDIIYWYLLASIIFWLFKRK